MKHLILCIGALFILASCSQSPETIIEFEHLDDQNQDGNSDSPDDNSPDTTPPGPPYKENVTLRLQWDAPRCRENDDPLPLSEIGGYQIYFGFQPDVYEPAIDIADNTATTYDFTIDADDVYHFAITAYDTNEIHSKKSNPITVTCLDANCTVTQTALNPDSCPADSLADVQRLPRQGFTYKVIARNGIPVSKNIDSKRRQGQARCPSFPLVKPSKEFSNYYSPTVRVTTPKNKELIQCNWRRHHRGNSKEENLIGYKRLNLHLPVFKTGDAFIYKDQIHIPYDLVQMEEKRMIALGKKLGGKINKNNVKEAFKELPIFSRQEADSTGSSYNENYLNGDFILLEDSIYGALSTKHIKVCDPDSQNKEEEEPSKPVDCLDREKTDFVSDDSSQYLKKRMKNFNLPVLILDFGKEANKVELLEKINNGSKVELVQEILTSVHDKGYVSFDLEGSATSKRALMSKLKFSQKTSVGLAKLIKKFNHAKKGSQLISYITNMLARNDVKVSDIEKQAPELIEYIANLWENEDQEIHMKAKILNLLCELFKAAPEQNRAGRLAEVYTIIKSVHHGDYGTYQAAVRVEDLDLELIRKITKRVEKISDDDYYDYSKPDHFRLIETLYRSDLNTSEAQIDMAIAMTDELIDSVRKHSYEYYPDFKELTKEIVKYVLDYKITNKDFRRLTKFTQEYVEVYVSKSKEEDYYDINIPDKELIKILHRAEKLILINKLTDNDNRTYIAALKFSFQKDGVYMYSFDEAAQRAEDYLLVHKLKSGQFYRIKEDFSRWTSRTETFLMDRMKALKLAEGTQIGSDTSKTQYKNITSYYYSLRKNSNSPLKEKQLALIEAEKLSLQRVKDSKVVNLENMILRWFTTNFDDFISLKRRVRKMNDYVSDYKVDEDKLRKMQDKYRELIQEGKKPRQALRFVERRFLGIGPSTDDLPVSPGELTPLALTLNY